MWCDLNGIYNAVWAFFFFFLQKKLTHLGGEENKGCKNIFNLWTLQFWNPNLLLSPKVEGRWWVNHSPVCCQCWALVFNYGSPSTHGLGDCAGVHVYRCLWFWMKWNMRQNCFSALATESEFHTFPAVDLSGMVSRASTWCWMLKSSTLKSQSRLRRCGPWNVSQLPTALFVSVMESSTYIKVPGQPVIYEGHSMVLAIRNVCKTKRITRKISVK